MAIIGGYDTDDLTQRQYHYFCILNKDVQAGYNDCFAVSFLGYCVKQNFSQNKFDNYDGDCDFLLRNEYNRKSAEKLGIKIEEIYL